MSFRKKSIAIRNLACNLEREWEFVCKDRVYVTLMFAARRREGVAVAPVGITNNMEICYVSVN